MNMLTNGDGKVSSGRVVKVAAFAVAVVLAFIGALSQRTTIEYVVAFLGMAGASEIVSKMTGR